MYNDTHESWHIHFLITTTATLPQTQQGYNNKGAGEAAPPPVLLLSVTVVYCIPEDMSKSVMRQQLVA